MTKRALPAAGRRDVPPKAREEEAIQPGGGQSAAAPADRAPTVESVAARAAEAPAAELAATLDAEALAAEPAAAPSPGEARLAFDRRTSKKEGGDPTSSEETGLESPQRSYLERPYVRGEEGSREDKEGVETDVLGEEQGMVAAGPGVITGVGLRGGETSGGKSERESAILHRNSKICQNKNYAT